MDPPESFSPEMRRLIEALTDNVPQSTCQNHDARYGPPTWINVKGMDALMHAAYEHVERFYSMTTERWVQHIREQMEAAGINGHVGLLDRKGTIFAYIVPEGELDHLMAIRKPSVRPKPWISEQFDFHDYVSLSDNSVYTITPRRDLYYVMLDRNIKVALLPHEEFFRHDI